MTVNAARFTIDGTPSEDGSGNRGYNASAGATLDCTLEQSPSPALSVTYEVYDPTDSESPLASKGSTNLTWVASGTARQELANANGVAQINMPVGEVSSYLIRCTAVLDTGPQVFERLVVVRTAVATPALRKTVPAESVQYEARGFSDTLDDMVDAIEAAAGGGGGSAPENRRRIIPFGHHAIIAGTEIVKVGAASFIPIVLGSATVNPNLYVATARVIKFQALVRSVGAVRTVEVGLFNFTDGVDVPSFVATPLTSSAEALTLLERTLTVPADLPNSEKLYQAWMEIQGTGRDGRYAAICEMARVVVDYA